jgi:DNA-binding CsgD family transcriptional regulator
MKARLSYLLVCLLLLSCNTQVDQANKDIDSSVENSMWLDSLFARVENYEINIYDPDKFIEKIIEDTTKIKKFKNVSENTHNYKALSFAYSMFGNSKKIESDYLSAIQYYKKAYENALLADDAYLKALSLNMMGVVYRRKSAIKTALEYYIRALKAAEESKVSSDYMLKSIAISNEGIGGLYRMLEQYDLALRYYKQSLKYEEQLGSLLGKAIGNHNIGKTYRFLAKLDSAKIYHEKSLEYNKQMNSVYGKAICYNNLGTIEMLQHHIDSAYLFFKPALEMANMCGDSTYIINSKLNLAWYHVEKRHHSKAYEYLNDAITIAKRIGYKSAVRRGYELLSDLEQDKGLYLNALNYFKLSHAYNDSIVNEKTQQYLVDLTVLYNIEKKKNEIESLQKDNETNKQKLIARNRLILLLILAVFIIIVVAYIFRQRDMQKLNSMETELQKYLLQIKDSKSNKTSERDIKKLAVKNTLSEREAEVLYFINEGMSNAEIAKKIFVSTNTIKYHIKNIYLKLDVKNRVEALNKIKP